MMSTLEKPLNNRYHHPVFSAKTSVGNRDPIKPAVKVETNNSPVQAVKTEKNNSPQPPVEVEAVADKEKKDSEISELIELSTIERSAIPAKDLNRARAAMTNGQTEESQPIEAVPDSAHLFTVIEKPAEEIEDKITSAEAEDNSTEPLEPVPLNTVSSEVGNSINEKGEEELDDNQSADRPPSTESPVKEPLVSGPLNERPPGESAKQVKALHDDDGNIIGYERIGAKSAVAIAGGVEANGKPKTDKRREQRLSDIDAEMTEIQTAIDKLQAKGESGDSRQMLSLTNRLQQLADVRILLVKTESESGSAMKAAPAVTESEAVQVKEDLPPAPAEAGKQDMEIAVNTKNIYEKKVSAQAEKSWPRVRRHIFSFSGFGVYESSLPDNTELYQKLKGQVIDRVNSPFFKDLQPTEPLTEPVAQIRSELIDIQERYQLPLEDIFEHFELMVIDIVGQTALKAKEEADKDIKEAIVKLHEQLKENQATGAEQTFAQLRDFETELSTNVNQRRLATIQGVVVAYDNVLRRSLDLVRFRRRVTAGLELALAEVNIGVVNTAIAGEGGILGLRVADQVLGNILGGVIAELPDIKQAAKDGVSAESFSIRHRPAESEDSLVDNFTLPGETANWLAGQPLSVKRDLALFKENVWQTVKGFLKLHQVNDPSMDEIKSAVLAVVTANNFTVTETVFRPSRVLDLTPAQEKRASAKISPEIISQLFVEAKDESAENKLSAETIASHLATSPMNEELKTEILKQLKSMSVPALNRLATALLAESEFLNNLDYSLAYYDDWQQAEWDKLLLDQKKMIDDLSQEELAELNRRRLVDEHKFNR